MSDDLRDLYQELILEHSKQPRNFRRISGADRDAEGYNPLCGDQLHIYIALDGNIVRDVSFEGKGCAICTASASIMTQTVKGKTEAEAEELFGRFHDLVTGKAGADAAGLGKLAVFSGVSEFPVRVKCASLAWHTLQAALRNTASTSTE